VIDKALIEADTELSRLLTLGLGPFAIASAYSIPVRRLSTDNQLEVDETHQSLPEYLKGSPGILTWDYLRSALADKVMEIWINEEKEQGQAFFTAKGHDRKVRGLQSGTSDEPRNMGDLGNRGADMLKQQMLENIT
tara:strand:- start:179 stop:586 length:408 start_codon:yes stop_codon:yes gene_type:complete